MTEWQPIKTAPMDGTVVLLYTPSGIATGVWNNFEPDFPDQPGQNAGWHGEGWNTDPIHPGRTREAGFGGADHWIYEPSSQPTHWMPLPEPPEDTH